jgi:hypothetical protein
MEIVTWSRKNLMSSRSMRTDFLVFVPSWQLLDAKLPSKTQSDESCGCAINMVAPSLPSQPGRPEAHAPGKPLTLAPHPS